MTEQNDQVIAEMAAERDSLQETHQHATKLLNDEIERIQSGGQQKWNFIELHQPKTKVEFRVKIPIKDYPQVNFVGKILGQGGENIRQLQEMTGCRIAVLGKGSMKDKAKAEELKKQGAKYEHLNHDLHVWLEAVGHPVECYQRLANAFAQIHQFLIPSEMELMQIQQGQNGGGMMRGGRGGRGGMPQGGRGGMGMGMGRGMPGGRGAPPGRGNGAPTRGAPRGAPRGGGGMMGGFAGSPPSARGQPRGAGMAGGMAGRGTRGAPRGAPPSRGMPSGRGAPGARGGRGGAQSLLNPNYGENYDYETSASGYDMSQQYGEAQTAVGYPAEASDAYQYESAYATDDGYGGAYGAEPSWGGDNSGMGGGAMGGAAAAGYGKAPAPTRGGLANFRPRPY